jgi:hypothetical protein
MYGFTMLAAKSIPMAWPNTAFQGTLRDEAAQRP